MINPSIVEYFTYIRMSLITVLVLASLKVHAFLLQDKTSVSGDLEFSDLPSFISLFSVTLFDRTIGDPLLSSVKINF